MIVHRRIIKLFERHCEAARRQLPEAGTSDHRTVDHGPPAARRNVNTELTICHNYRVVLYVTSQECDRGVDDIPGRTTRTSARQN